MKHLIPVLLFMLAAGCSLNPPIDNSLSRSGWDSHKARIMQNSHWQARGKIGINTQETHYSAALYWKQHEDKYNLLLQAPAGQGSARITGDRHYATLEMPGEPLLEAASPEELLQLRLGWQLPARDVRYWLRGIPAPDTPFDATFREGRLATLKQQGWEIHYKRYLEAGDLFLPGKLTMARNDLKLTLVIRNWQ